MNILILGAGVMQTPAIKKAKEMGHFVLCADGNKDAIGKDLCDIFYAIDIKDKNGLLEIAQKFHKKHILHGVFTAGTDFSTSVAWIAEKLNLPGIPYQVALNATDKFRMRTCFKEKGIPSPGFVEYTRDMNLSRVVSSLNYPLVVKPVDSMGSRGVRSVDNIKQLLEAVSVAIEHSRTSRAIIEEFIDGAEFSLDALVVNGEVKVFGFADREIAFPPYFVEMGHTMPTEIDPVEIKKVVDVFTDAVLALGINYGSAKGDMKLGKSGVVVGEIAARLSGGYMSGWTYPYSSGIDLTRGGLELALGLDLTIEEDNLGKFSAERALISIPGIISEINIPQVKPKSVMDRFITCKSGDSVCFPRNNVEKCGNIISLGDSRSKAIKSAEKYAGDIVIRLESNRWETQEFLFNDSIGFMPKAFSIDSSIYSALEDCVESDGETIYISRIDKILKSRKKDWHKRTVSQVLKQLDNYYKIEFVADCNCGSEFYKSLINGSIQGVLYYLDTLKV